MPIDPKTNAELQCSRAQRAYALAKVAMEVARERYLKEVDTLTANDPCPEFDRGTEDFEEWKLKNEAWHQRWNIQAIFEKHKVYEYEQFYAAAVPILFEWARDHMKEKIGAERFASAAPAFDVALDPECGVYGDMRQRLITLCMAMPAD